MVSNLASQSASWKIVDKWGPFANIDEEVCESLEVFALARIAIANGNTGKGSHDSWRVVTTFRFDLGGDGENTLFAA